MKRIFIILIYITANVLAQNSWQPTGLSTGQIRALTVDSSGNLYAARWAVGIFKSTNGGVSWNTSGLNGKRIFSVATSPEGIVYAFTTSTSIIEIYRSSDEGNSWINSHSHNIPNNSAFGGGFQFGENGKVFAVNSFTIGPAVGNIAAYMYFSPDSGRTFINTGIIGQNFNGIRLPAGLVKSCILGSENKLFAGTSDQGVLYTTNNGNNWLSSQIPSSLLIYDMGINSEGKIYAGLSGDSNNLLISNDNGIQWTFGGLNIPWFEQINDILCSNDDTIYIATDFNVLRSIDGGSNFDTINDGFPLNASVLTLCNTQNGVLYSGTLANGVYKYGEPLGIVHNNNIPYAFYLYQNYPNPFNPVTKISFSLPKAGNVKLIIYDVTGRVIHELINSKLNAGTYELYWNASSFASGIYFYTIESSGFTDTKKMILVK